MICSDLGDVKINKKASEYNFTFGFSPSIMGEIDLRHTGPPKHQT